VVVDWIHGVGQEEGQTNFFLGRDHSVAGAHAAPFLSFIGYFEGIDSERGIAYARVGFAVLTGILGPEPGGADTGSFHAVADAPVDEPGDTLMLAPGFSEPLDGRLITCILPPRSLHAPLYRSPA